MWMQVRSFGVIWQIRSYLPYNSETLDLHPHRSNRSSSRTVQFPIFSKFRPFPAQNSPFASEIQRGWHQKFRQLVKQPLSKGFLVRSYTKASCSKSSLYSSSSRSSTGTLSPMLVLLATSCSFFFHSWAVSFLEISPKWILKIGPSIARRATEYPK